MVTPPAPVFRASHRKKQLDPHGRLILMVLGGLAEYCATGARVLITGTWCSSFS